MLIDTRVLSIAILQKTESLPPRGIDADTRHYADLNQIFSHLYSKHKQYIDNATRNGNGSGSGQVFPYPDPTRGPRPTARTWPVY